MHCIYVKRVTSHACQFKLVTITEDVPAFCDSEMIVLLAQLKMLFASGVCYGFCYCRFPQGCTSGARA